MLNLFLDNLILIVKEEC